MSKGNGMLLPLAIAGAGALLLFSKKSSAANKDGAPADGDGAAEGSDDAEGGAADGSAQPASGGGSDDGDAGDGGSYAPPPPPSVSTQQQAAASQQPAQGGGMFTNLMDQVVAAGQQAAQQPQPAQGGDLVSNAFNTILPGSMPGNSPNYSNSYRPGASGGMVNAAVAAAAAAVAASGKNVVLDKLTPAEKQFVRKKSFTDADVIRRPDLVRYAMTNGKTGLNLTTALVAYQARVMVANKRHKATKKVAIVPNKNIVAPKPGFTPVGTGMAAVAVQAAKRAQQLAMSKGKTPAPVKPAPHKAKKPAPRRKPVRRKKH